IVNNVRAVANALETVRARPSYLAEVAKEAVVNADADWGNDYDLDTDGNLVPRDGGPGSRVPQGPPGQRQDSGGQDREGDDAARRGRAADTGDPAGVPVPQGRGAGRGDVLGGAQHAESGSTAGGAHRGV